MSELKYKIGDVLKNNESGKETEIIDIQGGESPYVFERGRISNTANLDAFFTKIEQSKLIETEYTKRESMNIEENKHHLLWKGKQSLDIMKAVLSRKEYIGFLKGQILKYQLRLGKKDGVEKELRKIEDYRNELNTLI